MRSLGEEAQRIMQPVYGESAQCAITIGHCNHVFRTHCMHEWIYMFSIENEHVRNSG